MNVQIYATVPAGYDPITHKPQTARALVPTDAGEYFSNATGATIFNCLTSSGAHIAATRAQMKDIEPVIIFDDADANANTDARTPSALAYKAIYLFQRDAARVLSALMILATPNAIQRGNGFLLIRTDPTRPRYTVTPKTCNCPDSETSGNTCKHRIAAWMYLAQHAPLEIVYIRCHCVLCDSVHWMRDGWTCEGKDVNPLTLVGMRVIKSEMPSQARRHAEIRLVKAG